MANWLSFVVVTGGNEQAEALASTCACFIIVLGTLRLIVGEILVA